MTPNFRFPATLALLAGIGLGIGLATLLPPDLAAQAKVTKARTGVGEGAEGDNVYSSSGSELASDELQVTLVPGAGERFLKVVDVLMGSETVRGMGHDKFLVRQGPNGQRDDWAAFFAAMPYVKEVKPKPTRKPSEQMPKGRIHLVPPGGSGAGQVPEGADTGEEEAAAPGRQYVLGEVLVKFKRGTSQKQIDQFMRENGTSLLGRLDLGADRIYRLAVPEGVEVPDMVSEFSQSPIVEYAEPNYKMSIPRLPGAQSPPSSGPKWPWGRPGDKNSGKPQNPTPPEMPAAPGGLVPGGMSIDTQEILGDSVFVTFRPGVREPVPDLVALVFGVEMVEEEDTQVRYSLPKGVNPLTAVRIFKLCPYVQGAEPSFGR